MFFFLYVWYLFMRMFIFVLILIVVGQFVKYKLFDLLRLYIDVGKLSAFKVLGFLYKIESIELF